MTTVFIAGSITIKNLHPLILERLNNIINKNFKIIIGDASGVDSLVQKELYKLKYKNVVVYCSVLEPRNNLGSWPVKKIKTEYKQGSRAFFTAKDIKMAKDADYGFMIWDLQSPGTFNNIFELLSQNKKSIVFINKINDFIIVKSPKEIDILISYMTDSALLKVKNKIKLSNKIDKLHNNQISLI